MKETRRLLFDKVLLGELSFDEAHRLYKKEVKGDDVPYRKSLNFIKSLRGEIAKQKKVERKFRARALLKEGGR